MRRKTFRLICLRILVLAPCCPSALWADSFSWCGKITAVDDATFHLQAYAEHNPAPPASPFVVETSNVANTELDRTGGQVVRTAKGELKVDAAGNWVFKGSGGLALGGTIAAAADGSTYSLKHGAGERFYGAGNEKLDFSGDLTHPSGTEIIENGATRVPFVWSTGGYSVLIANNQKGAAWIDEDDTQKWTMPAPYIDVYLSVAPTGYELLSAYARLTGPAPIPPRWTFGFMMSRWLYRDNADVQDKWHQFRDRKIPVDTFIYDYDWFEHDWEFNPQKFPPSDLPEMHRMGLHMVGIRKPRVNEANREFAKKSGWILDNFMGADLRYDIPEAAYWWWSHHVPLVQAGVDGWWNDEAEQTMDEFFQMSRVEWEGWRAMSSRRVWMINRGFAPGIQRFGAAAWTGDIHGSWDDLVNQQGTMLNWNLAGMPYTSNDLGGFENHPSPELYTRWIQSGVFNPVMRAHCTLTEVRWPWAFGDEALDATRKAIELRYRLIPYLYTLAELNSRTGAPLMCPLVLEYPQDLQVANLRDEWLLGSRLLAAPVMAPGGKREVYLPAGQWYDFNTGAAVQGDTRLSVTAALDAIPAFVRAGTILPLGPVLQSTTLGAADPLEVRVYPGADTEFTLYEDEGDNYAYQKGVFSRIPMRWNDQTRTLVIGDRVGSFPGMLTSRRVEVVLPGQTAGKTVTYDGRATEIRF